VGGKSRASRNRKSGKGGKVFAGAFRAGLALISPRTMAGGGKRLWIG